MKTIGMNLFGGVSLALAALFYTVTAQATVMDVNIDFANGDTITGTMDFGTATSGGLAANVSAYSLTIFNSATNTTYATVTRNINPTADGFGDSLCMTGLYSIGACITGTPTSSPADLFDWGNPNSMLIEDSSLGWFWEYTDASGNIYSNPGFTSLSSATVTSTVTSTVPEPASLALLGIGLVGLGASRKRKNKIWVE